MQRYQNQRMYVMIISCIIPFVGMLVMSLLPNEESTKWLKYAMFILTVFFSLSLFLGWSFSKWPPSPPFRFLGRSLTRYSHFQRRRTHEADHGFVYCLYRILHRQHGRLAGLPHV